MNKETVTLQQLLIGYTAKSQRRNVVPEINASVYSGELTCLLGENGVGKSTLLRTLSGFQPKLGGRILIEGKEISSYSDKQLSRLISVVLTEKPEIRNMTVFELAGMGRSPYTGFWGTLGQDDKAVVDNALQQVGIAHLKNRMVQTLSDGERQKVMIAKALAQETPIIYLDEPTAFLDFPSKVEVIQLLHKLTRDMNKTIFLSTHDLDLTLQTADKIWLMSRSEQLLVGTPEDLALSGKLGRFFSHKGVSFDMGSGMFRVENETSGSVRVEADGIQGILLCRALQRNGIKAGSNVDADTIVSLDPISEDYLLRTNSATFKLHTIEEVLQKVMSIRS